MIIEEIKLALSEVEILAATIDVGSEPLEENIP